MYSKVMIKLVSTSGSRYFDYTTIKVEKIGKLRKWCSSLNFHYNAFTAY